MKRKKRLVNYILNALNARSASLLGMKLVYQLLYKFVKQEKKKEKKQGFLL